MDQESFKTSIVCKVKKVVFVNEENGYSVLLVVSEAEDAPFCICGNLKGRPAGTVLHCQGEWKDHIMYGQQFIVDSWTEGDANEVRDVQSVPSRTISHPAFRTFGELLKNNPDIASKVEYVTEVFLTEVDKDFSDSEISDEEYTVQVTAVVAAVYYAVIDGQKYKLLTCTFTISEVFTEFIEEYLSDFELEDFDIEEYDSSHSRFYDIEDFIGLCDLDFHVSGVPVCEDEMRAKYAESNSDEYTIDKMKFDLEIMLTCAFCNAGIDYDCGEYQCTSIFSRSKISGDFV